MTDEVKNVSEVEIPEPTVGVEAIEVAAPESEAEERKPRLSEM